MSGERYRHIFLAGPNRTQQFRSPRGGSPPPIPDRDRATHSEYLRRQIEIAWHDYDQRRAVAHVERHGAYIDFVSEPGFELAIKSLENRSSPPIRLLNIRKEGPDEAATMMATVYVPHEKRGYFLKKVKEYTEEVTRNNQFKNKTLVESISDIRLSVLESFWRADERPSIPGDEPIWVEVWLSSDRDEVIERFYALLRERKVSLGEGLIKFPERAVEVILANRAQLEYLIDASDDIAEFRLAKEVASFFIELENRDQLDKVKELLARSTIDQNSNIAVTILDSGVNNGHLLLRPSLEDADLHTVNLEWGTHDHDGHGTLMAGAALYGDLLEALNSSAPLQIVHRLESVKILPPSSDENPRRLWGYYTSQGISRVLIQAPGRKHILCMAVTSTDDNDRGRPSSWSGEIDRATSGYGEDLGQQLFIVSAGNVEGSDNFRAYPESNLTNEVHDPGQAWNALTVGAYTEKVRITHPTLRDYEPIAPSGGLSPFSTTSNTWSRRIWPIKPEILLEGGNVARGPNDSIFDTEDLKLLSTYYDPQTAQFSPFNATSAAAAQASWMAAQVQERYQDAWPETIRGLLVHTAQWTDAMIGCFLPDTESKGDYAKLLRICGYGVPNLDRALYCAANSLTLVSQAELQPYDKKDGRLITRDMHLYRLPWPLDVLKGLGASKVEMRVTLSYFIEPGPGEIGWQDRYRYPSHALRFSVNGPGEEENDFVARINRLARNDGEHPGTEGPGDHWVIGNARDVGSIHSDIWQGSAADLATSNIIGIYPTVGWWRERAYLGRWNRHCRYSLIVSITTPVETVDIYTPVAVQVGAVIPVEVVVR
ncbi:MAG: S8 family peptidase [Syntrophorhabdaceae bacterium]|nr:S8 family peptidase [Syntrophorhabdaceae bacterium]